jgi:hypothetical protein
MGEAVSDEVRKFFERLERVSGNGDGAVESFAPVFLNADPVGEQAVTREALLAARPMREGMFRSMGVSGLHLESIAETKLGADHVLAQVTWVADGLKPGEEPLVLHTTYVLHRTGEDLQIIFYLNHQDLSALAAARQADRSGS